MLASENGLTSTIELLLNHGARINQQSEVNYDFYLNVEKAADY